MASVNRDLSVGDGRAAVAAQRRTRREARARLATAAIYGVLLIWLLFNVMPFVWTVMTSFKQVRDAFAIPPVLLFQPTFEAYRSLVTEARFSTFLVNSLIVTTGTVTISLIIGCLAGYALARYPGRIGFWILALALVFRSLPRISFLLPAFTFAQLTGLYDTRILLILVLVAINQPFTIWMLRSFFADIPVEIEEAAQVDGCSRFRAFVTVIMPLMLPGVITTGIFSLLLAYNEYLIPAILTTSRSATLPVAIATIGTDDPYYAIVRAAGSVVIALPIVVVVLLAQKYIVRGLTFGAVKG
jgi:multiple sugar transport system permease protein